MHMLLALIVNLNMLHSSIYYIYLCNASTIPCTKNSRFKCFFAFLFFIFLSFIS